MQKLLLPYNQQVSPPNLNQNEQNYIHTQHRRSSSTSLGVSSVISDIDSHENLLNILHSIEKGNDSYKHLIPFMNRIDYDFMSFSENSAFEINNGTHNHELFNLFFQYNSSSTQQTLTNISCSDLHNFLETIPLPAINDCLNYLETIKDAFHKWLTFREQELERDAKLLPLTNEQISDNSLTASETSSSPEAKNETPELEKEDPEKETIEECLQCSSVDTPEWRRGPYGPRSLCNACGLFYGKLIKRFGKEQAATVMARRKSQGNGTDRRIPIE